MSFTPPSPKITGFWRFASQAFDVYTALGGYPFKAERILLDVMNEEKTTDLGPESELFREALSVYCESVERDARPHGLGRFYLHRRVFQVAVRARLRIAPFVRAKARPARAPLIVCGLPRSGTTLLHRLLELADDAAGIPYWQLVEPMPPMRGPDQRLVMAERNLRRLGQLVPTSLDAQHLVRPTLADECGHLLRTAFVGAMPWQVPAYSWLPWSLQTDTGPAYRVWAAYLSKLEPAGKRLVLKDPFHMANLPQILSVCPDAMIVQTHRDPVEVLPSFHKLCTTMHAVLVPQLDIPRTVKAHTAWLESVVEKNNEGRERSPKKQLLDVDYRALVADPIKEVEKIHHYFGLPITEAHTNRMKAYLKENPQRKHGGNPYSAESFGQTSDEITSRFSSYRSRFGLKANP